MAITIINTPFPLVQAQEPVVYEVSSDSTESPLRIKSGLNAATDGDSVAALTDVPVSFELSDYLKGLFVNQKPVNLPAPAEFTHSPQIKYFRFWEVYGNPMTPQNPLNGDNIAVINSKIPESKRNQFYINNNSLSDYLNTNKLCMSWWPVAEHKKVISGWPEFIYFMRQDGAGIANLSIAIKLYLDDNSQHAMASPYNAVSSYDLKSYYFPVGYTQLGIETYVNAIHGGRTCLAYGIVVKRGTDIVSSEYIFEVDHKYYNKVRQLWIRNAMGFYDTVLLTGSGQRQHGIKNETASTDGLTLPDSIAWRTKTDRTMSVNTGFLTALQADWLTDLLDTVEAYEYKNGKLLPIVFRDCKLIPEHDGIYQFSADIEYEYASKRFPERM